MELRFHSKQQPLSLKSISAIHFDPQDESFQISPYALYDTLRHCAPVFFWEEGDAWLITRYEDVDAILNNGRFSVHSIENGSANKNMFFDIKSHTRPGKAIFSDGVLSVDRLKKFALPFFVYEKIDLFRERIGEIVDRQISSLGSRFDLVADYSEKISIRVIAAALGVPDKYLLVFYQFCQSLLDSSRSEAIQNDHEKYVDETMHIDIGLALLQQIIDQRRRISRREYLIDLILDHNWKGDSLTDGEIMDLSLRLIIDSWENMSQLISTTIYNVASRREALKCLHRHRELWPAAVLETLRYDYFIKLDTVKFAEEEFYIDRQKIAKGDRFHLLTAAALRDDGFVAAADRFDITRRQPSLLETGYRDSDFLGKNLIAITAEVAASRLFDALSPAIVSTPSYNSAHKTLRAISSLIMAAA